MLTLPASTTRSKATDASGTRSTLSAEPVPGFGADPAGFASLLRQSRSASMPIRVSIPLAPSEPASTPSSAASPSPSLSTPPTPASTSSTTRQAEPAPSPHPDAAKSAVPALSGNTHPHAADDADGTRQAGDAGDEAPAEPAAGGARPTLRARGAIGGNAARRTPSQAAPTKGAAVDDPDAPATGTTRGDAAHGDAPATDPAWPAWLASPDPAVRTAPAGNDATARDKTAVSATGNPVDRRDQPILVVPPSDERLTIDSKSPASTTNALQGQNAFTAALAEAGGTGRIAEAVNGSGASTASNEAAAASAALHAAAASLSTAASSAPPPTTLTLATPLASPDFSQALGLQMSLLAKDGVQSAELHLNPPEMGPVSVQITMDGTNARVSFGADVAETRHAIEAGLPELASALRDAGFTLAGGGVSQHSGHTAGQSGSEGRRQGGSRRDDEQRVSSSASLTDTVSAAARRVVTRGGLDLYA